MPPRMKHSNSQHSLRSGGSRQNTIAGIAVAAGGKRKTQKKFLTKGGGRGGGKGSKGRGTSTSF